MADLRIAAIRAREARQIAHEQEKSQKDPAKAQQGIADIRARAARHIAREQQKLADRIANVQQREDRERAWLLTLNR